MPTLERPTLRFKRRITVLMCFDLKDAKISKKIMLAQSKITRQGQISIPAEVRRWMGLQPGDTLSWQDVEGTMTVRRTGQYTLDDIRNSLGPPPKGTGASLSDLKECIAQHIREKYARY